MLLPFGHILQECNDKDGHKVEQSHNDPQEQLHNTKNEHVHTHTQSGLVVRDRMVSGSQAIIKTESCMLKAGDNSAS